MARRSSRIRATAHEADASGLPPRRSAERDLLRRVEKRDRRAAGGPAVAVGRVDLELGAGARELDRKPDVADIPLEARTPDQIGNRPDRLTAVQRRSLLRDLIGERRAGRLDP